MAYRNRRETPGRAFVARVGMLVVGCTAALTLSFVGLFAFVTGQAAGVVDRVPYYALGMAVVFVTAIIGLEQRRRTPRDGREVPVVATIVAVIAFAFLTLGGEGFVYAARSPNQALAAQRFLYLVAAGLISTGIGYWGVRNRRDVIRALR